MAHILVVDDSPTEVHFFKQILQKNGHMVSVATNGEEGVTLAKQLRPDLILMDVVMPVLNGFQATRQLTRDVATSRIPVVMVTTKDQDTDRLWAERQGAREYLVKPTKEKQLIQCINQVLKSVH
jgi:twitching motility two-component system response regulator PilH